MNTTSVDAPPPYLASNEAPPSYEESLSKALKLFEQKLKEDPDAATKALAKSLGSKEADAAFAAEMSQLSTSITRLDELFRQVHTKLVTFDAEKLSNEAGTIVEYAPLWSKIQKVGISLSSVVEHSHIL
jgi:Zn-dependent oligopeptidase